MNTAFDTLENEIKKLNLSLNDESKLLLIVKKSRRDFFTNMVIRSIDSVTANMLANSENGVNAEIEKYINNIYELNIPFVGILFHIFSYSDWAIIQKSIIAKGKNNG